MDSSYLTDSHLPVSSLFNSELTYEYMTTTSSHAADLQLLYCNSCNGVPLYYYLLVMYDYIYFLTFRLLIVFKPRIIKVLILVSISHDVITQRICLKLPFYYG